MKKLPDKIVFWGGTGQAKVCRPIVETMGSKVVAVIDDTPGLKSPFSDVEIFEGLKGFQRVKEKYTGRETLGFAITIGNPHGRVRLKLHDLLVSEGLVPVTLIHPSAFVEKNAELSEGVQVMAGAIVGAEAKVGKQVIVNTRASIDHEDILEEGSEVAPGATLCGLVRLEINAWVCTGATIVPRITVGHDAIVGAGSVVLENVRPKTLVVGVPAKVKKNL